MATNRIDSSPVSINQAQSTERQTPKTDFGTRVRVGASQTANAIGTAAGVAAPFVPGGAIVSAAVAGVSSMSGQAGSSLGAGASTSSQSRLGNGASNLTTPLPGGSGTPVGSGSPAPSGGPITGGTGTGAPGSTGDQWAFLEAQKQSNMQFLMLQSTMNQESQQYMTLSNILKVRHDTAKNTIGNVH